MDDTLQITYRGMEPSPALDANLRRKANKLVRLADGRLGCHVIVEQPNHHHQHPRPFQVRVVLHIPGADLTVGDHGHRSESGGTHENPYVAVREAFKAARRVLEHRIGRRRGESKRDGGGGRHGLRDVDALDLEARRAWEEPEALAS